jgi:hypothetical protein
MAVNGDLGKIRRDAVAAYFRILSHYLPENNHEKTQ